MIHLREGVIPRIEIPGQLYGIPIRIVLLNTLRFKDVNNVLNANPEKVIVWLGPHDISKIIETSMKLRFMVQAQYQDIIVSDDPWRYTNED